ncbi:MAG: hypothetical protein RIG62_05855 [Cyclobacteriaceae bacterium]|jgi:hypothetical protein
MNSFQEVVANAEGQALCRIVIEESLQEGDIAALKQHLLLSAETHEQVQIIIRRLVALELSALQWIMAFQRAALTEGKKVLLDLDLTEELQTLVDQSGLATKFNWGKDNGA